MSEVAPEHFELTDYYQRYFRVNVVADEIQFNCQLEGHRALGLLRQRLPYEINEVVALAPTPVHTDWRVQLEASVQPLKGAQLTARELEISIETVNVHKKHMYSKLDIKSQSELFSIFLQAQCLIQHFSVGAKLARDSVVSVDSFLIERSPSRASFAPTVICVTQSEPKETV